jgi:hypothetical protein
LVDKIRGGKSGGNDEALIARIEAMFATRLKGSGGGEKDGNGLAELARETVAMLREAMGAGGSGTPVKRGPANRTDRPAAGRGPARTAAPQPPRGNNGDMFAKFYKEQVIPQVLKAAEAAADPKEVAAAINKETDENPEASPIVYKLMKRPDFVKYFIGLDPRLAPYPDFLEAVRVGVLSYYEDEEGEGDEEGDEEPEPANAL